MPQAELLPQQLPPQQQQQSFAEAAATAAVPEAAAHLGQAAEVAADVALTLTAADVAAVSDFLSSVLASLGLHRHLQASVWRLLAVLGLHGFDVCRFACLAFCS